jgi:hypothetical protein
MGPGGPQKTLHICFVTHRHTAVLQINIGTPAIAGGVAKGRYWSMILPVRNSACAFADSGSFRRLPLPIVSVFWQLADNLGFVSRERATIARGGI